jgi:hypothetical protein
MIKKFQLFAQIVQEFVADGPEVCVPQAEFLERGISRHLLGILFDKAQREEYFYKKEIRFGPKRSTSVLNYKEDLVLEPNDTHTEPWYIITPGAKASEMIFAKPEVIFDQETSKIKFGDKEIQVPMKSLEFHLAQIVIDKKGDKIHTGDVEEEYDVVYGESNGPPRRFQDASYRINKKAKEKGIGKLICFKREEFWLNHDLMA